MTTYKIKLVSQTNSIILVFSFLTIFIGGAFLIAPHGVQNKINALLVVFLLITLACYLWQKFVTGRTEWTLDNTGVHVVWTKKFMFADNKDFMIKWDEIEKISKGFDPNYYGLTIKLVSGQTIRFYHDTFTTRDDFGEFIEVFKQTLNEKHNL